MRHLQRRGAARLAVLPVVLLAAGVVRGGEYGGWTMSDSTEQIENGEQRAAPGPHAPLWESDHPYYCTEGCYYVSSTLGHSGAHGYDGNTCHADYASWSDFKAGKHRGFSAEQLETRRRYGIKEPTPEEVKRQGEAFGAWSFFTADDDYNLLYRWDWQEIQEDEFDEASEGGHGRVQLHLFYMLQRKARPHSVSVTVTRADEPEIRAWLAGKWRHLQRLWSPFAPDMPPGVKPDEMAERAMVFYAEAARRG